VLALERVTQLDHDLVVVEGFDGGDVRAVTSVGERYA
jgi:hypothetical protein